MLGFLRVSDGRMIAGEAYEKLPRFIPYAALPIGLILLSIRFIQATYKVVTGEVDSLIASHESEDLVHEAAAKADREG